MMKFDNLILGENTVVSTDSVSTGVNNNVLVVGGTGSGKTMSVSEPALLETCRDNMIVTLTKRRLVDRYKRLFQERGYRVLDLNFAEPAKGSVFYDPLAFVCDERDAASLAEAIVEAGGRTSSDPYWDNASVALLTAEIAAVNDLTNRPTFKDVMDLHGKLRFTSRPSGRLTAEDMLSSLADPRRTVTAYTTLDEYYGRLEAKDPDSYAVSCWRSFREMPEKTARCIFGTLNPILNRMFPPQFLEGLAKGSCSRLDLESFTENRSILFVTSRPGANAGLQQLIALFYSQVFGELFRMAEEREDRRLPRTVRLLCDDFAAGGKIKGFAENISVFREKGISVTLLIQSQSQLEALYGDADAATIVNNCDSYVYMGGMDTATALEIAKKVDRPLDEVLWMPVGDVWIMRRGQRPIRTRRYDIQADERWQRLSGREDRGRER